MCLPVAVVGCGQVGTVPEAAVLLRPQHLPAIAVRSLEQVMLTPSPLASVCVFVFSKKC